MAKGSRPGDRAGMVPVSVELDDVHRGGDEDRGLVEPILGLIAYLVNILKGVADQHIDERRLLDVHAGVSRPRPVGLVRCQALAVLQHDGVHYRHGLVLVVLLPGLRVAQAEVDAVHLLPALAVVMVEDPRRCARREGERGDDGHCQDDQNLVGIHGAGRALLGIIIFLSRGAV